MFDNWCAQKTLTFIQIKSLFQNSEHSKNSKHLASPRWPLHTLAPPPPPLDDHQSHHPGVPISKGVSRAPPWALATLSSSSVNLGPLPIRLCRKCWCNHPRSSSCHLLLATSDLLHTFNWLATNGDWHLTNAPTSRLNAKWFECISLVVSILPSLLLLPQGLRLPRFWNLLRCFEVGVTSIPGFAQQPPSEEGTQQTHTHKKYKNIVWKNTVRENTVCQMSPEL